MITFNLDLNSLQPPLTDPKQVEKQILEKRSSLFALKRFWYDEEQQLHSLKYVLSPSSYYLNIRMKLIWLNSQAARIILLKNSLAHLALPFSLNERLSTELHQLKWDCAYFVDVIFFPLASRFDNILAQLAQ